MRPIDRDACGDALHHGGRAAVAHADPSTGVPNRPPRIRERLSCSRLIQVASIIVLGSSQQALVLAEAVRFELTDSLHRRQFSRLIH